MRRQQISGVFGVVSQCSNFDRLSPSQVAAACRLAGAASLVWLDSATEAAGARSLVAAEPDEVLEGEPGEWDTLAGTLTAFQNSNPGGAVIGWVEYGGRFRFGCYAHPAFYDHSAAEWTFPAGTVPPWFPANLSAADSARRVASWEFSLKFQPDMDPAQFCSIVEAAQSHIAAGDIYQVNLAHRLQAGWPSDADPFSLYCALRVVSPAPQAAFLAFGDAPVVLSSSPEDFLHLEGRTIRTRPIKGTRPRHLGNPAADISAARDLVTSSKERAELLMIIDLMRNDLGQVCEYGSVRAPELFRAESFAQVHHLVATVEGALRAGVSHADALHACLPGGSITGAPKRRARDIIAELEPVDRGIYTGSIGCFGFGHRDFSRFNIAIRTLIVENGYAHFHVGAGIVADSVPAHEWQETLDKAAGILRASQKR